MVLKDICAKCVWYDQCSGDEDCDLSPIDTGAMYEDEYQDDLKIREVAYKKIIIEINGENR